MEDHVTRKIARPHFAIPKDVNEDGISDLFKKLYAADFIENQALSSNDTNEKLIEVSAEYIKFQKLVDEECTRSMVITSCQCHSEILQLTYQITDGWLKGDCNV